MIIDGQEELYHPIYFVKNDEFSNTFRTIVKMKKEVDGAALDRAVQTAIKRYPYFRVEAVVTGNQYTNIANDRPFVVREGNSPSRLLSEDTNYHPMTVRYEGQKIMLDGSHYETDGFGSGRFFHTILYYYLKETEGISEVPDGVDTLDTPFYDGELGNILDKVDFQNLEESYYKRVPASDPFRFGDMNVRNRGKKVLYHLKLGEKEFLDFARSHDGSPTAMLSVLMTEIIWKLSNTDKTILNAIAINFRGALGNQYNYRNNSMSILAQYASNLKKFDTEKLCTISRGMIMLQQEPASMLQMINRSFGELGRLAETLPSVEAIQEALESVLTTTIRAYSTDITYVGRLPLGYLNDYVDAMYASIDTISDDSLGIISYSVGGSFDISFLQGFDDEIVVNAFMERMQEEHIPCEFVEKEPLICPYVDLKTIRTEK